MIIREFYVPENFLKMTSFLHIPTTDKNLQKPILFFIWKCYSVQLWKNASSQIWHLWKRILKRKRKLDKGYPTASLITMTMSIFKIRYNIHFYNPAITIQYPLKLIFRRFQSTLRGLDYILVYRISSAISIYFIFSICV